RPPQTPAAPRAAASPPGRPARPGRPGRPGRRAGGRGGGRAGRGRGCGRRGAGWAASGAPLPGWVRGRGADRRGPPRPRRAQRGVVAGGDTGQLLDGLGALAGRRAVAGVVTGVAGGGKTAVLLTGQGSQRVGMGRQLYERLPVFSRALDEVCAQLDEHLPVPLREVMWADAHSAQAQLLAHTQYTQPAVFAIEVALYRLLTHYGIVADYLIGHSIGELTAAYLAEVWSLSDAARLVAARGRLMQALPPGGVMFSIQASEDELRAWCEHHPLVGIAA